MFFFFFYIFIFFFFFFNDTATTEIYTAQYTLSLHDALPIHDWGGTVAWMMPLLHRERVAGVIGVNTPYFPRPSAPPISLMRMMYGENYYMVHFQQPGIADRALARDVRRVFTRMMRAGVPQDEFRETVRRKAGPGMHNMV